MVRIDTAVVAARLAGNWGAIFPKQQEAGKKKGGVERMNRVVAR
jgi:hypothetical protein